MNFPVELKDISEFEKNNPDFSVNVFGFDDCIYPLRISKGKGKAVDLLLLEKDGQQHFCFIKSLSTLLSSQINHHDHKKFICKRCLNSFVSEEKLNEHMELCQKKDFVKIEQVKKSQI